MASLADLLNDEPLLLIFGVLGVGAILGAVGWKGVSLGPAGALFAGLAASAWDERLVINPTIGFLGLALFTYCVGVAAGPALPRSARAGAPLLVAVTVVLAAMGPVTLAVASLLDIGRAQAVGVYAGSLTNTPALAAARELVDPSEAAEPVVGYALAYPYGVLGILLAIIVAGRKAPTPRSSGADERLQSVSVRVGRGRHGTVDELIARLGGSVVIPRVERNGEVFVPDPTTEIVPGDVLSVTCAARRVAEVLALLGDRLPTQLTDDRSRLDFRRMVVSNNAVVGVPLSELQLTRRHGATITRVRRGTVDSLATADTILEPGDRVRVVAPPSEMAAIARELGDDERRVSEFHPRGFMIGMVFGLMVGLVPIPIPGVGTVELGSAGGPLIVGLVLGWLERSGPFVWQVPHGVSFTLRQLGSLLFLGMAGTSGGEALRNAITGGDPFQPVALGLLVTSLAAGSLLLVARRMGLDAAATGGLLSGSQTQPAALAFAAERTGDPGLDLTYAMAFPVAMLVKIVVAQLLVLV